MLVLKRRRDPVLDGHVTYEKHAERDEETQLNSAYLRITVSQIALA
jgi:hypothetical protein